MLPLLVVFIAICASEVRTPSKFAAISLLDSPDKGFRIRIGTPSKYPANPLFGQDKPWETRIDNGYPNVVPPSKDYNGFQLWYGNQATNGTRNRYSVLFANSTDGINWSKPNLGIFDFSAAGFPNFAHLRANNNIVVEGDGVGVYYDPHDPDPSRRYKAIGDACWLSPTLAFNGGTCDNLYLSPPHPVPPYKRPRFHGVIASSADGLIWPKSHIVNISWPPPHKWDTHNNVFFDEQEQAYIVTTRSVPVEPTGLERETSLTRSTGPRYNFDTSKEAPPVILRGNISHQTYAQITFPWLNIYLGLVMVFDQDTGDQVHCRLAFAKKPEGPWHPVEGANIVEAPDFLPLGVDSSFDSHVIFAAARPFRYGLGNEAVERIYYMGGDGPHNGPRKSSFGLATLRPDGFASIQGHGKFITPSLIVTAPELIATVDFGLDGGTLRIGVLLPSNRIDPPAELSLNSSIPIFSNGTDIPIHWYTDRGHDKQTDLSSLLGKAVRFEVKMEGSCILYSIGFT